MKTLNLIPSEKEEQKALVSRCKREGIRVISIENSLQFPINMALNIVRPFVNPEQLKKIELGFKKMLSILTAKRYSQGLWVGCPDLFFPKYHLYIEMKTREGGVVSKEQLEAHAELREMGYKVEVCKGAGAGWQVIQETKER
jgi:hypothetical protein